MQAVSSLEKIRTWLENNISEEKIEMKAPSADDGTGVYALAAPGAYIGYVPPATMLNQNEKIRIPCLVVGLAGLEDSNEESTMALRITAAIYDPGYQSRSDESQQLQLQANFDGYITLLNFLDCVKEWVTRNDGIGGEFQLDSPVSLKTYDEQPWPYWYGTLEFTVLGNKKSVTRYTNVLN